MGFQRSWLAVCRLAAAGLLLAVLVPASAQAWVPGIPGFIAYASNEGAAADAPTPHIWVIAPDGSQKRQLTHGADEWPSWDPSGGHIVFARNTPSSGWRIWVMKDNGTGARAL